MSEHARIVGMAEVRQRLQDRYAIVFSANGDSGTVRAHYSPADRRTYYSKSTVDPDVAAAFESRLVLADGEELETPFKPPALSSCGAWIGEGPAWADLGSHSGGCPW